MGNRNNSLAGDGRSKAGKFIVDLDMQAEEENYCFKDQAEHKQEKPHKKGSKNKPPR